MAGWLRVTAIPNEPDAPRAKSLVSLDRIWGFNAIPGQPVQIWFSANPAERALSIVESMEDIEVQLGLALPGAPAQPRYGAWEHVSDVLGRVGVDTYDGGQI